MLAALLAALPPLQLPDDGTLYADLNPVLLFGNPQGSSPRGFVGDGSTVYFHAFGLDGRELWSTDGSAAGTVQVGDVLPGPADSIVSFNLDVPALGFLPAGPGVGVMTAAGPGTGQELWRVEGPQGPIVPVADLRPGAEGSLPMDFVEFQGELWFHADDGVHGRELWRTDGTAAGTVLGAELLPGPDSAIEINISFWPSVGRLASTGSKLLAATRLPGDGFKLYATDGTQAGTTLILDLDASSVTQPFREGRHAVVGGRVVFEAGSANPAQSGIWVTDGTIAGTERLFGDGEDLVWAVSDGTTAYLALEGGRLYGTDGTIAGTVELMGPGLPLRGPTGTPGVFFNGRLFLGAWATAPVNYGTELVSTDGTLAGTQLEADLVPGVVSSGPDNFSVHAGELYFRANLGNGLGAELFRSDGTAAGTVSLGDLTPGPGSVQFGEYPNAISDVPFVSASQGLIFPSTEAASGREPWRASAAGAEVLLDIDNPELTEGSDPGDFVRVGDDLYFTATIGFSGRDLFRVPGDASGPVERIDLNGGGFPNGVSGVVPFLGGVACLALTSSTPFADDGVWWTDGVQSVRLSTEAEFQPFNLTPAGDQLYFTSLSTEVPDTQLFVSDGTALSASLIDLGPNTVPVANVPMAAFNGGVAFAADVPGSAFGWELGYANAEDGQVAAIDLSSGSETSNPSSFLVSGDRLFFRAESAFGSDLWVSDGTLAGTVPLLGPALGGTVGSFGDLIAYRDGVAFVQFSSVWVSDGTVPGTVPIVDVAAVPISPLIAAGDSLFFRVVKAGFDELWVSDGTPAGTAEIAEFGSGVFEVPAGPSFSSISDGVIALELIDSNGEELWTTDGTAAGTQPLADSWTGSTSGNPDQALRIGSKVWFSAVAPATGRELHVVDLAPTGIAAVTSLGTGCGSAAAGLAASDGPRVGQVFDVALASGLAGAPVALYFDVELGPLGAPADCSLLLPQPLLLGTAVADGTGAASLPLAVPSDPALAGSVLYLQAFALAAGEPFLGLGSLTNALEALIGS